MMYQYSLGIRTQKRTLHVPIRKALMNFEEFHQIGGELGEEEMDSFSWQMERK